LKNNVLFSIVGILVLGLIFSPAAFGVSNMVNSPKKTNGDGN
jgi:hypothetical protein